jgi:2'-5' RNA ligase
LVNALIEVQNGCTDLIEPQAREHMHITLAYLPRVDAGRLAEAAAFISTGTWTGVPVVLTGEIKHGSGELQKDPRYRYDPDTVQAREQVRLGVQPKAELTAVRARLLSHLGIPDSQYWPHVTLGLARRDAPASSVLTMQLPAGVAAATGLELQQEITTIHFRVLARATLPDPAPRSPRHERTRPAPVPARAHSLAAFTNTGQFLPCCRVRIPSGALRAGGPPP